MKFCDKTHMNLKVKGAVSDDKCATLLSDESVQVREAVEVTRL